MPTQELPPVPYPRDEHEARIVLAIYAAVWGSYLAGLTVQIIRDNDIGFMLALLRYLRWRRKMRRWVKKWNGER
jgi:hypothetical protein